MNMYVDEFIQLFASVDVSLIDRTREMIQLIEFNSSVDFISGIVGFDRINDSSAPETT